MRGQGILVLNEKMPDRARILLQNVERMGVTNAVVTCADPAALADRFEGYFDKILVDAPCSGEGMLRKEAAAAAEWSEQNVLMCADRQAKILESAARMLAPGGALVYSTCTFSREEDEDNAARFAAAHPDFVKCEEIKLYPHRVRGEGHYAVRFTRAAGERRIFRPAKFTADRKSVAAWRAFAADFLDPAALPQGQLALLRRGALPAPARALRAGRSEGAARPASPSAFSAAAGSSPPTPSPLALPRAAFARAYDCSDEEIARYLRGEELEAEGKGWCAVCCRGYPVGLGKLAGGRLKNHYPKGLRH